jgi:hypothetical protein
MCHGQPDPYDLKYGTKCGYQNDLVETRQTYAQSGLRNATVSSRNCPAFLSKSRTLISAFQNVFQKYGTGIS